MEEETTTAAPTPEEVQAAQAVIARDAAARQDAEDAHYEKVRKLVSSAAFKNLRAKIEEQSEYLTDPSIMPYIMAIRTGMDGLSNRLGVAVDVG